MKRVTLLGLLLVTVFLLAGFSWNCVAEQTVSICSFNIKWLGSSKSRDNIALATILKDYDIVIVQELIAPPYPMAYPDGALAVPDDEARAFFEEMIGRGFSYWLSEEDTGPGDKIHSNTTNTEWWVAFFKPEAVIPAVDLPQGFIQEDRSKNPCFERVPYGFSFRTPDGNLDFVLISVHLKPNGSQSDSRRRTQELASIAQWIGANDDTEKDFIILGDMNIQNRTELDRITPWGFVSLNETCRPTNTATTKKPYDHVMYRLEYSHEVKEDFIIIDLVEKMRGFWTNSEPYPGDPYDCYKFPVRYSDHNPIVFYLEVPDADDD